MYNDDATAELKDAAHFWAMVEDNFEFARHVLEDYAFETRDEAAAHGRQPMSAISFRNASSEMDQREHYYEMGRTLLPMVRAFIDRREQSFGFIQAWGKLMFCHGLVAGFIFDDSTDSTAAAVRNAEKSAYSRIALHRGWLAHIYAMPQFASIKREAADAAVAEFVISLRSNPAIRSQYDADWFDKILNKNGTLRAGLETKNFSKREMTELRKLGTDGLPPIPDKKS